MHPNYVAEMMALRRGSGLTVLPVGARVRVVAAGSYRGKVGRIIRHGRTSYHVRVRDGVLRVPFALAEPA